jgi:hypothetical protein
VAAAGLASPLAEETSVLVAAVYQQPLHVLSPLALAHPGLAGGGAGGWLKGILIGGGAAQLGGAGGVATVLAGGGLLFPTGP